jgi:hypothetical protein
MWITCEYLILTFIENEAERELGVEKQVKEAESKLFNLQISTACSLVLFLFTDCKRKG